MCFVSHMPDEIGTASEIYPRGCRKQGDTMATSATMQSRHPYPHERHLPRTKSSLLNVNLREFLGVTATRRNPYATMHQTRTSAAAAARAKLLLGHIPHLLRLATVPGLRAPSLAFACHFASRRTLLLLPHLLSLALVGLRLWHLSS